MKKPFVLFRTPWDVAKFAFCIALCAGVITLFFVPEEAVTVFNGGDSAGHGSLYALAGRLL